jgi:hypothetical protein
VNDPPIEFFSKIGHSRIASYTKSKLHARNQQNIMISYRQTDRPSLHGSEKSLRPNFSPPKKGGALIFSTPQKSLHRSTRPYTRPLDHPHPPYYHQYPLKPLFIYTQKKNLLEGPLGHGKKFQKKKPPDVDYLSSGVKASTHVTHHSLPYHPQVTNMPTSHPTRLICGRNFRS